MALRGNTYADSHQKLLVAMQAGDNDAKRLGLSCLGEAAAFISCSRFTTNIFVFPTRSFIVAKYTVARPQHNMNCEYCR
jgi:hypothetical protein